MDDKQIDLLPNEWLSERSKPKEPFFGIGIWWFLELAIMVLIATPIVHYFRN